MGKIETLAEYQQLASRTCPDLGNIENNIIHMRLGIKTEIGETLDIFKRNLAYKKDIDFVNLAEELADQMWYVANHARLSNDKSFELDLINIDIIVKDNFLNPVSELKKFNLTVNILDQLLIQVLTEQNFNYINYIASIVAICNMWNIDFMQSLTNNIEKLKVRFPEKFDEGKALKRNLKAERTKLEVTK